MDYLFHLLCENKLCTSTIQQEDLDCHQIRLPTDLSIADLRNLSPRNITNTRSNIMQARNKLSDHLISANLASPRKDQLLRGWQQDCRLYNSGMNMETNNFQDNNSRNGQQGLTLETGWILRHIMYSFGIPLLQMPSLWAAFYYLILRKPIPERAIASQTSIWNHVYRVHLIDSQLASDEFRGFIRHPSEFGFTRNFGISTDGSKHGGNNRNVVLMTSNRSSNPAVVDPSFTFLTCSVVNNKGSDFSAKKNVDTMVDALGLRYLAHFGGGTNDNAPDAIKELRKTFEEIIDRLLNCPDPAIKNLAYRNGVLRRVIVMGDPYHIANLCNMHFSITAWGDTNKDDYRQIHHRQIHHRQVLQSLHSLRMLDKAEAQELFEGILREMGLPVERLKTKNERIQR